MSVKAQSVSKKKDNKTLCRPSKGYSAEVEVDLEQYEVIEPIQGELPESDETYPAGAPLDDHVLFDGKLYRKKGVLA